MFALDGVQIELKMAQNRDFPAVSRCAARKIRRLAKSGIKENQFVSVINESPSAQNWRIC